MRSGLSQARMAKVRPPRMSARCTPCDRRQARLHDADQVVGDLVVFEDVRAEAQVHRRDLRVGRLDVDGGDLRLGRQVGAHLIDARADVGERAGGGEVQLEPHVDGRQALRALRLDVVDAVGGGDGALERRGDEAAHQSALAPT